jgi:hypothetical protein
MKEQTYISNLKRLQVLIQDEFSTVRQSLSTVSGVNQASLESIVKALQSEDIINQRIQHLIDGVNRSKVFFNDSKFKHSFLALQYFHLVTVRQDLWKTITSVRILMEAISLNHHGLNESVTRSVRFTEIEHLFKITKRTSFRSVAQRIVSGTKPLNSTQAGECLELYTMQSERIVLQWFLSNMPFGKDKDLLRVYEEQMNNGNDSIEFF